MPSACSRAWSPKRAQWLNFKKKPATNVLYHSRRTRPGIGGFFLRPTHARAHAATFGIKKRMSIFKRKASNNYFRVGDLVEIVDRGIKGRVAIVQGKWVTIIVKSPDGTPWRARYSYKRLTRIATAQQIAEFAAKRQPAQRVGLWARIKRFFTPKPKPAYDTGTVSLEKNMEFRKALSS